MAERKMLNPQVNVIPATRRYVQNGDQFRNQTSLRVAAYCRVSTEEESQENSYATQKSHYTSLISSKPGWEMAGIYADEGKSGTTRKGRVHFNELIEDCKAGKIDYIITKSISRFARNTADALECVHELQRLRPPVGIYFERENIDTLNANSEMFLTFYCSMAQEESHSISENIKWAIQKNFRSGKPQINLGRMIGYDKCSDNNWVINEKEAEIVRYIYKRFNEGVSGRAIAKELNAQGRKTVNGKEWRCDGIMLILRNEKYCGDLVMQKTYVESFLTHRSIKNEGELPQYYFRDHHPAIIERDVWDRTQELIDGRDKGKKHSTKTVMTDTGEIEVGVEKFSKEEGYEKIHKGGKKHPFFMMTCSHCKKPMRRMYYNAIITGYTDERSHEGKEIPPEESSFEDIYTFSHTVWKCPNSLGRNGEVRSDCTNKTIIEASAEQSFMEMIYRIKRDYEQNGENSDIMKAFKRAYDSLCRKEIHNSFIEQKINLIDREIEDLDKNYKMVADRLKMANYASTIQIGQPVSQTGIQAYTKLAEDLKRRLDSKQQEKITLLRERGVSQNMKENFENFITALVALPNENRAGMRINVNRLDTDGSIFKDVQGKTIRKVWNAYKKGKLTLGEGVVEEAPDYLHFDEHIFRTYFSGMTANGDEICYTTTFGLKLKTTGNTRPIGSYLGFRVCKPDGTAELVTQNYQISNASIQHHWREPWLYTKKTETGEE